MLGGSRRLTRKKATPSVTLGPEDEGEAGVRVGERNGARQHRDRGAVELRRDCHFAGGVPREEKRGEGKGNGRDATGTATRKGRRI